MAGMARKTLLSVAQAKGLSFRRLSKRLDIHYTELSHIAAGRRVPSLRRAHQIAKALHLSLDEFHRLVTPRKA
jgi:transcriptional regulator with XRE-family HTH domain